ncbi:MAG TPA: class I SAM-dependent methyltransferase [Kofleriaceae bacterium]
MHVEARTAWGRNSHEARIERLYGHRLEAADSHGGFLNFGLWEDDVLDYLDAAQRMVERVGELAELGPGARIVDAACGTGAQDAYLAHRFGPLSIDAVDVTWHHVDIARRRAAELGAGSTLRVHHASATALPLPDATATHVISIEAAHHFATRAAFFAQAHRVLVPGGVIALADFVLVRSPRGPIERALFDATCALWKVPRANADTADAYETKLEHAGFCNVDFTYVGDRTFAGYLASQRRPERRKELALLRGRVGIMVGELMAWAAHAVYAAGLVEYVLVRAER